MSSYNKSLHIFITTQFKEKDYLIIWFDYTHSFVYFSSTK